MNLGEDKYVSNLFYPNEKWESHSSIHPSPHMKSPFHDVTGSVNGRFFSLGSLVNVR